MPAISVDTFFACALMVLLVLSAMATTSKILYPHINNEIDTAAAERYREVSKYLLLNSGTPPNWGQNSEAIPEMFGLAKTSLTESYELDIDKVSRLNSENFYALSYGQIFNALGMSDISFKIEIKPLFEVALNLTATFTGENETIYQFEVLTRKHGVPVQTELKHYVIAENYFEGNAAYVSEGEIYVNVTLPNHVNGPALLAVFAKTTSNSKIVSFETYTFMHNSSEPKPENTFLRLSPLNHILDVSLVYSGINLSKTYALTCNYNAILTQTSSNNQSAEYAIPHFLDSSPTLLVATGWNSTAFFAEWVAYPQIPVQIGADFTNLTTLSNIFTNTYVVAVNSALYECTIWLGGPRG
ncbi:hypothetical protein HXY33_02805 [Candidatus Bathyarchaeota archaeon]|nr:hypothetical protein [Candidatus Bathyarchaeota archaeon]